MTTPIYNLHAGRVISKDEKPFAAIIGQGQYEPVEIDEFAHTVVNAVNHHAMLVEALRNAAGALDQIIKDNEYSRSLDLPAIDTTTYDLALQHARKALAAVKGDR